MGYKNFGFAKTIVSNRLSNEFLTEGTVKSNDLASKFLDVVKESELLQQEFKIFENIEKKHISNDALATRYIDENIKIFEQFSKAEMIQAHNALDQFIDESFIEIEPKKYKLYESLDTLLFETAKGGLPDVDAIHESFEIVLEYVKSNTPIQEDDKFILLDENIDLGEIIPVAINKFNSKFSNLDENQRNVLSKLVYGNTMEKQSLFETLKIENIEKLNSLDKNGIEDKINETIDKISKMKFNENNVVKDTIDLYELKSSLS